MDDKGKQERTPETWARELGAELHGMSDERWDAYLVYLETEDEIAQAVHTLLAERDDMHVAWRADKWARPEDRDWRLGLQRTLRELRTRRLADLQVRRDAIRRGVEY